MNCGEMLLSRTGAHKKETRVLNSEQASNLDRLVMQTAALLGLRKWRSGITVRSGVLEDGYEVDTDQFRALEKDLARFPHDPHARELLDSMQRLDLISPAPNYNEFKELFKTRLTKIKKPKIVFLIGAGASKPKPSGIPTINEMLSEIVQKLPPIENPIVDKIKEWASRRNVTIEDIMTAGYLSSQFVSSAKLTELVGEIVYRSPEARRLEPRFQTPKVRDIEYVISFKDLVDRIFSVVSGIMIKAEANSIHESVSKLVRNCSSDADFYLLTTNYDVCLEKALRKEGLKPQYLGVEKAEGVPLVKIHGSVNWFYCEGCQDVISLNIEELGRFDKVYPTTGTCLKCNTLTQLFMVPPVAFKYVNYPPIVEIWQSAMRVLQEADIVIVIGYSFSLADDYLLKMIVSGMKKKFYPLIFLTNQSHAVNWLQERLVAYHEAIALSLVEDAAISAPKICEIIQDAFTRPTKAKRKNGTGT
jgi:NAD-dependent SIR2 family protein deacetylase